MASIILRIDGEVTIDKHDPDSPTVCGVWIKSWADEAREILLDCDRLSLIGPVESVRAFASEILAALPPQPAAVMSMAEAEPIEDELSATASAELGAYIAQHLGEKCECVCGTRMDGGGRELADEGCSACNGTGRIGLAEVVEP